MKVDTTYNNNNNNNNNINNTCTKIKQNACNCFTSYTGLYWHNWIVGT